MPPVATRGYTVSKLGFMLCSIWALQSHKRFFMHRHLPHCKKGRERGVERTLPHTSLGWQVEDGGKSFDGSSHLSPEQTIYEPRQRQQRMWERKIVINLHVHFALAGNGKEGSGWRCGKLARDVARHTVAVTVAGSCGWMRMDHKIKHNASKINRNGLPS